MGIAGESLFPECLILAWPHRLPGGDDARDPEATFRKVVSHPWNPKAFSFVCVPVKILDYQKMCCLSMLDPFVDRQ